MSKPSQTLIATLAARQEAAELNEREFAAHLGVGQATWTLIRTGQHQPGVKFIRAVLRRYPDLKPHVLHFLQTASA